jgi:hypothetical protein
VDAEGVRRGRSAADLFDPRWRCWQSELEQRLRPQRHGDPLPNPPPRPEVPEVLLELTDVHRL